MLEVPDRFYYHIEKRGSDLVARYYKSVIGDCDRYLIAKRIVETYSGEALIEYLADMLCCIDRIKLEKLSFSKR
jgi:hypothetical protein